MKLLLVMIPVALALCSCAGVTVGIGLSYKGVSATFNVQKIPKPQADEPVVELPDTTGKEPVPVDPVNETQPQT